MLHGIPDIISPELLKILHEMGHADEIVIGDANYPAASTGKRLVRCDGHSLADLLEGVLTLFPLDTFVAHPVGIMVPTDPNEAEPAVHAEVRKIVARHDKRGEKVVEPVERFAFYERAKNAYAVVATTEKRPYGCVVLKKGVIA
ncbi:MAG TPA: RbsD/FucU domain-containing protein [Spirochaetia bacterium]|nr:RbsD/FucU domain-containing protein [Spirochaetia bacterium]